MSNNRPTEADETLLDECSTTTSGCASAERVFALLDCPETIPEPTDPVALERVDGRIELFWLA
ncbi:hypothetical protein [Natronorubrum halophilum]|uniref:hypothetical protein n=1 Tax=Natronorubrum halophilum TaxID=1702106 RepID=UPI000EF74CE4|nr:hypothetical protein [Natronorubrum halophilum]